MVSLANQGMTVLLPTVAVVDLGAVGVAIEALHSLKIASLVHHHSPRWVSSNLENCQC